VVLCNIFHTDDLLLPVLLTLFLSYMCKYNVDKIYLTFNRSENPCFYCRKQSLLKVKWSAICLFHTAELNKFKREK